MERQVDLVQFISDAATTNAGPREAGHGGSEPYPVLIDAGKMDDENADDPWQRYGTTDGLVTTDTADVGA